MVDARRNRQGEGEHIRRHFRVANCRKNRKRGRESFFEKDSRPPNIYRRRFNTSEDGSVGTIGDAPKGDRVERDAFR
jgi:hypothetical protein